MAMLSRRDRILGALLGVHAGDSLGATLEFESWEFIKQHHPLGIRSIVGGGPFNWPAGHATDDTDLTRAVLLAYRDRATTSPKATASASTKSVPAFDIPLTAGNHMLDWLDGNWPGRRGSWPVDIGNATAMGLDVFRRTGDPRKAGAGRGSAGNGSLMRCIPTALFEGDFQTMVDDSMVISGITHNDKRCMISCAAYNAITRQLIDGADPKDAVQEGLKLAKKLEEGHTVLKDSVSGFIEKGVELSVNDLAENGPKMFVGKASGYVLESLAIAIAAVLDPRPMVDVLVDVVRIGKDTDTNAAIAGGLLGARDGVQGLSTQWRMVLQFGDEFEEITNLLLGNQSTEAEDAE